jgi:acyl-CoA synthetase (AMP-forming)/AMP-acid ligase II
MAAHGPTIRAFSAWGRVVGLQPDDRYLIVNPFFHSFGYKAGWVAAFIQGATVYPEQVFEAEAVLTRIAQEKISFLPGPPTLFLSMLAHPKLKAFDISSLRVAVTGSANVPPILITRMREELGIDNVTTAYGLTECGGCATVCDPEDSAETVASTCGRAIPGTEVRCVDAQGQAVPTGEPGEVQLRGYHVMQGYFGDEAATREAIDSEGWLHTGDVGVLDANGYLKITDRLKDMFILGGFNCYPAEIERLLADHPAIAQVAGLINHITFGDVTKIIDLDEKFDLAMSLEVAEHIPESCSDILVENLCNAATKNIIFTAAGLGQGGTGHINCQEKSFWIQKFNLRGWTQDLELEQQIKNKMNPRYENDGNNEFPIVWDFVYNNLMVFKHDRH